MKYRTSWCSADSQLLFPLDSVPFSALHMASCIFSIFTSPNWVHKTTVKQMVISPVDSLTFEKQTCGWKDCSLNLQQDWKLNKKMPPRPTRGLPTCSRQRQYPIHNRSFKVWRCAHNYTRLVSYYYQNSLLVLKNDLCEYFADVATRDTRLLD